MKREKTFDFVTFGGILFIVCLLSLTVVLVVCMILTALHTFESNYSITGVVKNIEIVGTRHEQTVYVNLETADGTIYNFKYTDNSNLSLERESFNNLTRLSEGDRVELSIYSIGYYLISSEKTQVAIYVKDVKWLK